MAYTLAMIFEKVLRSCSVRNASSITSKTYMLICNIKHQLVIFHPIVERSRLNPGIIIAICNRPHCLSLLSITATTENYGFL